jgi:dTDP-4-amino-4,6-dideoxy-D-galactose acyltransferase
MKIERIDWDSNFFNFEVGKVSIDSKINSLFGNYKLLISNEESDEVIQGFTNKFSDVKIIFNKFIKQNSTIKKSNNDIVDADMIKFNVNEVYNLAYESGKFSRFYLDKNFGESKFKELYKVWVDNSLNKKIADKTFFILNNKKIIGFITFKINDAIANVGLFAVLYDYQGRGIGKDLISSLEYYCLNNNIEEINIPTQLKNKNACKFYEKMGYTGINKIFLKHYWKNGII